MKTMTIRNIPEDVYDALVESAHTEHRSIQEQVRYVLENEAKLRSRSVCEQAAEYRTRLSGRTTTRTVVEDLREDRNQ
mgnify:CR=1 FL=1